MLTTLAIIAGIIAILIIAVLVVAATRPATFRVQRTASVDAPPEKIFPLINDYRKWTLWSPYEHRDPALKRTYGGAESGTGATYAWQGNKNVGEGRMETIEASPPHRIVIRLEFFKPFKASNVAEFTVHPMGGATNVTWAMQGPNLFIGKVMSVFISMDRMVGKDFEVGLANLKTAAEGGVA